MKAQEDKYTNGSGIFPNWTAVNSSGPGIADGSEYVALNINDGWEGVSQAIMNYAAYLQKINAPTGSIGVPNGVTEANGISQILQAIQKAHGIGPGNYVPWANYNPPSVTGDRVILLAGQGILIADYPALDAACYVGDANNSAVAAAGGYFYRSSDSGGTIPNIAGPYIQLPPQPSPTFLKRYLGNGTDFTMETFPSGGALSQTSCIPYKTTNGMWKLKGSILCLFTLASRTFVQFIIPGLSFSSTGLQPVLAFIDEAIIPIRGSVGGGSNIIEVEHAANSTRIYYVSYDLILNDKPTWADDWEYKWGIRY